VEGSGCDVKVRDYAVLCPEGPIKTTKHSYRTFSILTEIRTRDLPKRIHKLFGPTCSERIWNAPSSSLLTGMSWYQPEYILKLRRQRRYPQDQQYSQKPKADRCTPLGLRHCERACNVGRSMCHILSAISTATITRLAHH